jgi:hypothetical protein
MLVGLSGIEFGRFAHRLNPAIVHRDLKPANILVQRLRARPPRAEDERFSIGVS